MNFEKLYLKSINKNLVSWLAATSPTDDLYKLEENVSLELNQSIQEFIKTNPEHPAALFNSHTILPKEYEEEKINLSQKLWIKYQALKKNKTAPDNEYFALFDEMVEFNKKALKYYNKDNNLLFFNDFALGETSFIKNVVEQMANISKEFIKNKPKNKINLNPLKDIDQLLNFIGQFKDVDIKISDKNGSFMTAIDQNMSFIHVAKNKKDIFDTSTSITHELGHALYQNRVLSKNTYIGKIGQCVSLSLHESSSIIHELALSGLNYNVKNSDNNFYRLGTDKVHYIIHIYIRMKIEEMLFNDEIKAKDISSVWNKMILEYIGIEPKNDWEGFMQDVHLNQGAFGYFHSYAIGFLNAVIMYEEIKKSLTDDWFYNVENVIIPKINSWYGKYNEESDNILSDMHKNIDDTLIIYKDFIFKNFNYEE